MVTACKTLVNAGKLLVKQIIKAPFVKKWVNCGNCSLHRSKMMLYHQLILQLLCYHGTSVDNQVVKRPGNRKPTENTGNILLVIYNVGQTIQCYIVTNAG